MSVKTVAVIGAGASGLTAIKCCLDEGLEPTCFERTDYIGGLWHYTPEVKDGQACVMKSTVINTSKEMMCYSDFPIPEDYAIFMHNKYVDRYFNLYADKFQMRNYINFNTEVVTVKPTANFLSTGQWEITTRKKSSDTSETHVFDSVLVCTGHHANVSFPTFPGMDKFKGKLMHSHDYKDYHGFDDKRVIVVGFGNSGGDIAVELSRVASQVFLSTRRGAWILNRVVEKGAPNDMTFITRFNVAFNKAFPNFTINFMKKKLNNRFDHKKYSLQPNHHPMAQHPTVNDDLPNKIISGSVVIKSNIREFKEKCVIFDDGTQEEDIDCVILATGYVFGFPFLDKSVLEVHDNKVNMYKYMFPPDQTKHTLAVIGCFQPLGAIMPICENQCRLATRVFKNLATLPSSADMWADIKMKEAEMAKRYITSPRHTIQVDYIPYMDELAELYGCKPALGKLFLTDPKLAFTITFGPGTPYQYRLMGPGSWSGAREAIMTQWKRTYHPLKTRACNVADEPATWNKFIVFVVIIAVGLYYIMS